MMLLSVMVYVESVANLSITVESAAGVDVAPHPETDLTHCQLPIILGLVFGSPGSGSHAESENKHKAVKEINMADAGFMLGRQGNFNNKFTLNMAVKKEFVFN